MIPARDLVTAGRAGLLEGYIGRAHPVPPAFAAAVHLGGHMLDVHSPAFDSGGVLPQRFADASAGGSDVSPPLSWSATPAGTRSLAVTCVDHAPIARDERRPRTR